MAQLGRKARGLGALVSLLACACAADVGVPDTDGPLDAAAAEVGRTQQALESITGEFVWTQGSLELDLGPTSDRFCFLTFVSGDFEGGAEFVTVQRGTDRWTLKGGSLQTGVSARARCVPLAFAGRVLKVGATFSWSQGRPPNRMADDDGLTACFLTHVQGKFKGGAEVVEVQRSNGAWFLTGSSQQRDVAAKAICVRNVLSNVIPFWNSCSGTSIIVPISFDCDHAAPVDIGPLEPAPGVLAACGLGKMSGKFEGGGEFVQTSTRDGRWRLWAVGKQETVYSTSAVCIL